MTFEAAFRALVEQNAALENPAIDAHIRAAGPPSNPNPIIGLGFIITENDEFVCIDLDVKDDTPREQIDLYYRILQTFDTYSETSLNGRGLHVWCRADSHFAKARIPSRRRDGVEVYSTNRFMICTGNRVETPTFTPVPTIANRQELLENLVSNMGDGRAPAGKQTQVASADDAGILARIDASDDASRAKFVLLWGGQWSGPGSPYPSQSEADFALLSMLCFYAESDSQVKRLFRQSALGKRKKALANDAYLDRCITRIRGSQQRVNIDEILKKADAMLMDLHAAIVRDFEETARTARLNSEVPAVVYDPTPSSVSNPTSAVGALSAPEIAVPETALNLYDVPINWPPGMAGAIAQYMYGSAPRPVREVAIVSTLGLLAGICGKAWHIPQSGLNLYIVLIARSGVGKEAMHSGISNLIRACADRMPTFHDFIDFSEYVSGPALLKACAANPSFLNVAGEFGRKLRRMAIDERDSAIQGLRTCLTNLYQKSGPQAILGGLGYSDSAHNVESIAGVSYSMIGETTPGTFYESLSESMMEDGFLSRFLLVEYHGKRPPMNPNPVLEPDAALQDCLLRLSYQAQNLIATNRSQMLARTGVAADMMRYFDERCDAEINATDDESRRQIWNRAALKLMRIAGLLAVADNWIQPCIAEHHVTWALEIVTRNTAMLDTRAIDGDIGLGDHSRARKLVAGLRDYCSDRELPASYRVPANLRKLRIVTRTYLQMSLSKHPVFARHPRGSNLALDSALADCVDNGLLIELDRTKTLKSLGYRGKCYQILALP